MNETAVEQNEDTKIPLTKRERIETEALRINILSKELASAFWRKNYPVK
jgi:hypothetical protein